MKGLCVRVDFCINRSADVLKQALKETNRGFLCAVNPARWTEVSGQWDLLVFCSLIGWLPVPFPFRPTPHTPHQPDSLSTSFLSFFLVVLLFGFLVHCWTFILLIDITGYMFMCDNRKCAVLTINLEWITRYHWFAEESPFFLSVFQSFSDDSNSSDQWGPTPQQDLGAESIRATEDSTGNH